MQAARHLGTLQPMAQNGTKWEMEREVLKLLKTTYLRNMNDEWLPTKNDQENFVEMGQWQKNPGDKS